ncbi:uncharacterized protein LOC105698711 [Orussus abietinus]|uniref:uncharacterized protein LOC105698711 n=1 Tax=Orussus abietinus TaxID=222816 RepID=UPI000626306C|nr:uncharacterized protein LOC105698711 [Orussus abietinus]
MADLVEQNCGTNLTEKRNFDICGVMSQLRMINDLLDERSTLGKRLSSKNLLRLDEVLSVDITMYLAEKIRELTKENGKLRHAKLVKSPVYTLKDAGKCEGKKHLESGEKGRLRDDENGGVYNTRKYSGQNSVILRFGKENRGDEGDKDNFQDEFAFPIDDVE